MNKKIIAGAAALAGVVALAGCSSDANVVSQNISKDSDQFKIERRIVFFNGITDKYLLSIEGYCSIDTSDAKKLAVTCKTGSAEYKKHYLGLSDNVTYFVEQLEGANVSPNHYTVIFKPETIIPSIQHP
ncbi:beta-sandwich lipoprotein [Nocardia jiangxiensis]|uniref:beta-sandwich lipoprotein n=1 Tax=Nocardia jiangxiensis TaxID=282685 RepID=UPI0003144116|nr:hypothetical protein [Nocardia jiangxiensis]